MEPKQQAPYPLRMPPELRERLEHLAGQSKRSLNAEIVERLEKSFSLPLKLFHQETQTQIVSLKAELSMIAMRHDLARSRSDNLDVRIRLISAETERLTKNAKTDEDFQRARDNIDLLSKVEKEAQQLERDMTELAKEREEAVARLAQLQGIFDRTIKTLEGRVSDGVAARQSGETK